MELAALLDEIVEKYKVDQDRIYVTGLSMAVSALGRWPLISRNRFAAIVPICGGGEPIGLRRWPAFLLGCFMEPKIRGVPPERSKQMVEALKKDGGDPKFTIYPEAGHDCWTQAYNTPELYEWLLKQKRTPKKAADSKK